MIRIVLLTCVCIVATTCPLVAGDGYYYAVDDSISVNISNNFMAVQLDTLQIGVDIGMIVTGKPCLSSEPEPEHLGRGFYIVALAPECSYDLAAGNLMTDPEGAINAQGPTHDDYEWSSFIMPCDCGTSFGDLDCSGVVNPVPINRPTCRLTDRKSQS